MGRKAKCNKPIKPKTSDKTDCFAYHPTKCVALTKKNCEGCSFYKTKAEVKADREKAVVRIHSLDEETQERIIRAYFGGDNNGSL